jgi:hypothetical protein
MRQPLVVPPDSKRAWLRLVLWEVWMGMLVSTALVFAARLFTTAGAGIITVYDLTNCYAVPPIVQPCERVAYRTGSLGAAFNLWCGVLLVLVAVWLIWELWTAVAPKPITDDFLRLLDDSFGRSWRSLRTWPWARLGWAYGFTLAGAASALAIGWVLSSLASSPRFATPPLPKVETSLRFRP